MGDETQDRFVRQRRNLIAVSIVLFVSQLYDVTITKLNLLGNEFNLHSEYHVATVLWIAAIYWLVRYLQVLHEQGDLGFRNSVRLRSMEPIRKIALQKYTDSQLNDGNITKQDLKLRTYSIAHAEGPYLAPGGFAVDLKVTWVSPLEDGAAAGGMIEPRKIDVSHSDARYVTAKAWLQVLLYTTKFSEYVLPPLLFLVPVGQFIVLSLRR